MKKAHFYAYGVFANEQSDLAKEFGVVNLKQVAQFIENNKDADSLIVHIHSDGGDVDEGFAIHDLLINSGKEVNTVIEGNCKSIATVVALAGSKRQMTENSNFFIHNAWGGAIGNAEELHEYADVIKEADEKILDFYVNKTGGNKEEIKDMMAKETSFTPEQARAMGFVTEIIKPVSAMTIKKFNKTNNNQLQQMENSIKDFVKNMFSGLKKDLKIKDEDQNIKALDLTTDKGVLHFETESEMCSVGDAATIDGSPAGEGDYTMENGTVISIDAEGKVSKVTEPTEDNEEKKDDDVAALKSENENLKNQIRTMKDDLKKEFEAELNTQINALKKQITSNYQPPQGAQGFRKQKQDEEVSIRDRVRERQKTYKKQ